MDTTDVVVLSVFVSALGFFMQHTLISKTRAMLKNQKVGWSKETREIQAAQQQLTCQAPSQFQGKEIRSRAYGGHGTLYGPHQFSEMELND